MAGRRGAGHRPAQGAGGAGPRARVKHGRDRRVHARREHLFFAADGRTFLSRTIDGQFPAYKRIVPADAARVAILDRVALAAALRRVALLATTTRSVRLELSPGALRVVSSDPSVGDATEDLAAEYDGPTVAVALNGAYVKDFLDAAWTERVSLSATTDDIPTVWRPVDGDIDYLCVIMPMRV